MLADAVMLRLPLPLLLAALLAAGEAGTPFTATADLSGRPGHVADNGLLAVGVSPLGARVLRLDLAGRPLLWTDPVQIAGMHPPAGDETDAWWFRNRGGICLWPAPQGQWKRTSSPIQGWPPPPAIERGEMRCRTDTTGLDMDGPVEVHPQWQDAGMQASYRFTVPPEQARLRILATWTNRTDHPQRWGQWILAALPAGSAANPAEVVWPLRKQRPSRFGERGYMQHGGAYDPEMWRPDPAAGLLRASCLGRPGKISSDSDGGWIAWRDPADGATVAIRFTPTPDENRLPDGFSSVACNMLGAYAVEAEAMGPERDLDPGQALVMTWELAACRTAGAVRSVAAGGCIVSPPAFADGRLRASLGVFARGALSLRRGGLELARVPCTPAEPLILDVALPTGAVPELVVVTAAEVELPLTP